MRREERLVITAMGIASALGDTCDETFRALLRGETAVSAPPFELPFATVTGSVRGPLDALPAALREYDSRLARIAWRALAQVTASVERARARYGGDRIAVLVGTSTGGLDATEPAFRHFRSAQQRSPAFSLRRTHAFDAVAALTRDQLGLSGPAYAVSTACTSSAKAIASAARLIGTGSCDAVLVIGVDALCETTVRGFHALGVLSTQAARPFCAERDGIHIGEAAALLLLERSGDGPACIAAVGESSDAHSMSAPEPAGLGASAAITQALRRAGIAPEQVDYVNAHGTGTVQNDVAEAQAIRRVLPAHVPVSSSKGMTGHTLGACGALEVLFAALAIAHGELPPSAGAAPLDTSIDLNVLQTPQRRNVRVALSNSLAFGGSNACVVVTAP
jgi:3-oxoacyl-[acyl-carrier-protein] synthase-1